MQKLTVVKHGSENKRRTNKYNFSYDGWLESSQSAGSTKRSEHLTITFAAGMLGGHNSANFTAYIAALNNISVGKAQTYHEFIEDASDVLDAEISIKGRR